MSLNPLPITQSPTLLCHRQCKSQMVPTGSGKLVGNTYIDDLKSEDGRLARETAEVLHAVIQLVDLNVLKF